MPSPVSANAAPIPYLTARPPPESAPALRETAFRIHPLPITPAWRSCRPGFPGPGFPSEPAICEVVPCAPRCGAPDCRAALIRLLTWLRVRHLIDLWVHE